MADLSDDAKQAIRNYMIKVVVIPGAVLVVASAIAGYVVKSVGEQRAYTETLSALAGTVVEDAKKVARATEQVQIKETQATADSQRIGVLRKEAEATLDVIKAGSSVDKIVDVLRADTQFAAGVTSKVGFDRDQGVKLCAIALKDRWTDVVAVPAWSRVQTCDGLRRFEISADGGSFYLGCLYADGTVAFGPGGITPPAKNCGW